MQRELAAACRMRPRQAERFYSFLSSRLLTDLSVPATPSLQPVSPGIYALCSEPWHRAHSAVALRSKLRDCACHRAQPLLLQSPMLSQSQPHGHSSPTTPLLFHLSSLCHFFMLPPDAGKQALRTALPPESSEALHCGKEGCGSCRKEEHEPGGQLQEIHSAENMFSLL